MLWQNRIHDYVASKGRTLHVWNDQLYEGMPTELDPGVVVDYWVHQDGRMTPAEVAANGNDLVNVSDSLYYAGGGPPNAQWIYETFTPSLFTGGLTLPAGDPHLLGAAMGVWPAALRRQPGRRRTGHVRPAARARPEELGRRPAGHLVRRHGRAVGVPLGRRRAPWWSRGRSAPPMADRPPTPVVEVTAVT